jgi:Family of unknown function (DUF6084)
MASPTVTGTDVTDAVPTLTITIEGAEPVEYAAVPMLRFRVRIHAETAATIRSIALHTQIRIASNRRRYDADDQERLVELFGAPAGWARTLRSLLWAQTTTQVPAFSGETAVEIPVGCSYDFEVAATKYLHALGDGEVPLDFLFSGTVFYDTGGSLRAAQIPWDTEAEFRMPVEVWKDTMAHYFPNSAWLRLHSDTFDRLYGFKARNMFASWESAIEELLSRAEAPKGGE